MDRASGATPHSLVVFFITDGSDFGHFMEGLPRRAQVSDRGVRIHGFHAPLSCSGL